MIPRSTPQRRRRNRRIARSVAPVAGLLAAGLMVWQGSVAAFTAQTENEASAWETGSLDLTNDGGGGAYAASTPALFNETLIKPGTTGAKCITVQSTGDLAGDLRLSRGALTGTNETNLAGAIDITVDAAAVVGSAPAVDADCTGYAGTATGSLFDGTLAAMPTAYADASSAAALAGGTEFVTFRIGWSMAVDVTDNSLQGSSVATDLIWEVQ